MDFVKIEAVPKNIIFTKKKKLSLLENIELFVDKIQP